MFLTLNENSSGYRFYFQLTYKVKFSKSNAPSKTLTAKSIAYDQPAMFQFEVGSRVIALFHNPEELGQKKYLYYAGIVAEGMKVTNNYRYDVTMVGNYTFIY
jgi:Histone methyltransferase Tudor domain 1